VKGQEAFANPTNKCADCHTIEMKEVVGPELFKWASQGGETGPDLSNYGSAEWIRGMIMRPGHVSRYRDKNLMPAFRDRDGPGSEIHFDEFRKTNKDTPENRILHLPDVEREMIIRWML